MKLKIVNKMDKEEFVDVGFWSFTKCTLLSWLAVSGIVYGVLIVMVFFALILAAIIRGV